MRKTAAVLFMLICLLSSAWAQQQPQAPKQPPKPPVQRPQQPPQQRPVNPPPEKPQRIVPVKDSSATIERLRKLFRLNGDQVFNLRSLVEERNRQQAVIQEQAGNAQSRKSELDSLQQRFQSDFRAILTLAQAAQFDREIQVHPGSFR